VSHCTEKMNTYLSIFRNRIQKHMIFVFLALKLWWHLFTWVEKFFWPYHHQISIIKWPKSIFFMCSCSTWSKVFTSIV